MTPDDQKNSVFIHVRQALEWVAIVLSTCIGLALWLSVALAAAGVWPWLSVPAMLGSSLFDAGPVIQLGAAVFLTMILALLPASVRVMRLEQSHRAFRVDMEDVTRAYYAAHAADRAGVFKLHREYDAVRERLTFLRTHPDLGALDPELLELAAQMSGEARDLADIYSDEKVAHAEAMLLERSAEADRLDKLVDRAHGVARTLRQRLDEVGLEEDVLRSRIGVLREELDSLWPEIEAAIPPGSPARRLRVAAE